MNKKMHAPMLIGLSCALLLSACGSDNGNSIVNEKYQQCKMIVSVYQKNASSAFKPSVDCDAGKAACDDDIDSQACQDFLSSIRKK